LKSPFLNIAKNKLIITWEIINLKSLFRMMIQEYSRPFCGGN
jgi:hypothetical protein